MNFHERALNFLKKGQTANGQGQALTTYCYTSTEQKLPR